MFKYYGYDQTGHKTAGTIEASDRVQAEKHLLKQGIYLSDIKEIKKKSGNRYPRLARRTRIKTAELTLFIIQLASLVDAGLQLDRALEVLANQKKESRLGEVIAALMLKVRAGSSLSEAMSEQPMVFSELQIQMVRAGEMSGHLEVVLEKLAGYSEKEEARRTQVKSSLTYPVLLVLFAFSAISFIISYVIPKMSKVFLDFGSKLPWTTVLLIKLSALVSRTWPVVLMGIAGLVAGGRIYFNTEAGKLKLDQLLLRLPLIKQLLLKSSLARFARTMAVTGEGGVGVMDGLEVAAGAAGNRAIRRIILGIRPEVRDGKTLTVTFRESRIFPEAVVDMVMVGEETGNLEKIFTKVAEMYEFEVDAEMKRLLSLLEPALIIVMGVMVAFIVISVLVPLSQIGMDF